MTDKVTVTEADKIWEEIANLPIAMYALANQTVRDHVEKIDVPGDKLFVRLNSSAVIASLETALGDKYELEQAEGYTMIKRASKPLIAEERGPKKLIRPRRR